MGDGRDLRAVPVEEWEDMMAGSWEATRKRRWFFRTWLQRLDAIVDHDLRDLSRSELATMLVLLRETRPDGTARAGLADLATRGGMSRSSAARAVKGLVRRGLVAVVKPGVPGKVALYSVLAPDDLRKLNPTAAKWVEETAS